MNLLTEAGKTQGRIPIFTNKDVHDNNIASKHSAVSVNLSRCDKGGFLGITTEPEEWNQDASIQLGLGGLGLKRHRIHGGD